MSNQKVLFNTVDKLLHLKPERRYPTENSISVLANNVVDFFNDKIVSMRNDLSIHSRSVTKFWSEVQLHHVEFTHFQIMTTSQVDDLIGNTIKSCNLDPISAPILKECKTTLLPVLTKIVNLSLQTSTMPTQLKEAFSKPKLKKDSLDPEVYSNFRPISNLKFVSKMIEKAVVHQLKYHLTENNMDESFQSAYKQFHSTETALVKVQNDILSEIDNKNCIVLIL